PRLCAMIFWVGYRRLVSAQLNRSLVPGAASPVNGHNLLQTIAKPPLENNAPYCHLPRTHTFSHFLEKAFDRICGRQPAQVIERERPKPGLFRSAAQRSITHHHARDHLDACGGGHAMSGS